VTCQHPATRQRLELRADPDGMDSYEVMVCLDCRRELRAEEG